jgi:hypothetical protein
MLSYFLAVLLVIVVAAAVHIDACLSFNTDISTSTGNGGAQLLRLYRLNCSEIWVLHG